LIVPVVPALRACVAAIEAERESKTMPIRARSQYVVVQTPGCPETYRLRLPWWSRVSDATEVKAAGGDIGHVKDFYFDDEVWVKTHHPSLIWPRTRMHA
jgi:hypothetical protein